MNAGAPPMFLVLLAVLYLTWGTVQTLCLKWSDTIQATDGFSGAAGDQFGADVVRYRLLYSFAHPFTQAFFMFCAESVCLVLFLGTLTWKKFIAPRLYRGNAGEGIAAGGGTVVKLVAGEDYALPCNPCVWLLPSGADFLASIIQNVGMMLTYASVYQMLRGATVVWIAVISYFWLGRRFTKVELWGMGCVVVGLSLVGLSNLLVHDTASVASSAGPQRRQALGNFLVISAQVLHAYQGVCEERLVRLYRIPPLQMVGTEGIYGVGMTLCLLAFLQLVPMVPWGHNLAAVEEFTESTGASAVYQNVTWVRQLQQSSFAVPYDDVVLAFAQVRASWQCALFLLLYIPAGVLYNACQVSIIKYVSAAATVMLGSLRNVTVWIVCLLIPSIFEEHFNAVQFLGFLFLVFGNVLFQRVWITRFDAVLPVWLVEAWPTLFHDTENATEEVTVEAAGGEQEEAPAGVRLREQSRGKAVQLGQEKEEMKTVERRKG